MVRIISNAAGACAALMRERALVWACVSRVRVSVGDGGSHLQPLVVKHPPATTVPLIGRPPRPIPRSHAHTDPSPWA
jgi:hypothetical protein